MVRATPKPANKIVVNSLLRLAVVYLCVLSWFCLLLRACVLVWFYFCVFADSILPLLKRRANDNLSQLTGDRMPTCIGPNLTLRSSN